MALGGKRSSPVTRAGVTASDVSRQAIPVLRLVNAVVSKKWNASQEGGFDTAHAQFSNFAAPHVADWTCTISCCISAEGGHSFGRPCIFFFLKKNKCLGLPKHLLVPLLLELAGAYLAGHISTKNLSRDCRLRQDDVRPAQASHFPYKTAVELYNIACSIEDYEAFQIEKNHSALETCFAKGYTDTPYIGCNHV